MVGIALVAAAERVGHAATAAGRDARASCPGAARPAAPCASRPCRRRRRSAGSASRPSRSERGGPSGSAPPPGRCRDAAGPRGRSRSRRRSPRSPGPVRIALQQLARFLIGPGLARLSRLREARVRPTLLPFRSAWSMPGGWRPLCPIPRSTQPMAASGSAMPTARVEAVGRGEAIARAAETPMIMLNAPLVGNRLGYPDLSGLDLLELFAFVHPARFAVPTPKGLADALGLAAPDERRGRGRLPARGGGDAARHARAATGPSARAPGRRRRRSPGCAGPGRGAVAEPAAAARARRALAVLAPARMGGERRRGRSRAPVRIDRGETAVERLEHAGRRRRRGARRPARLCRRRRRDLRPAPRRGPAQPAARRGRHRDRQDPGLSRARLALGRARRTARSGSRPSPRRCSASSTARARGSSPTRPSASARIVDPQGPRELSLPAQPRGRAAGRLRRPRRDPRPARRALGGLQQGRRHGRRRPAGLADQPVPPRRRRPR